LDWIATRGRENDRYTLEVGPDKVFEVNVEDFGTTDGVEEDDD
jgi:hypothetical protein